jgi:hypothetical protein
LKYRVKRIEEILGTPIRDPRCAFHLQLATTIHQVRSGLGRSDSGELPPNGWAPPAARR